MKKRLNPEASPHNIEQDGLRNRWRDILWAILGGLAAMSIWQIGGYVFGLISSFWGVLLGFIAGLVVASVVWFFVAKRYPDLQRKVLFLFSLAFTMLSITGSVTIINKVRKLPAGAQVLKKWDFEDGTTQSWGIYDGQGRVVESPDVAAKSEEFADGTWCLRVDNINIEAESQKEGTAAFKKWLAVRYEGNLTLTNAKLAASVYTPAGAGFAYTDAKFFLFLFREPDWEWRESGMAGQGVLLEPGKWVELAWDLRFEETRQWPSPWPWRNILGIQIYVEGTFKGPVYIDNVAITVPK